MTKSSSGYRADIDGLRALAILPVIVFHAQAYSLPGGYLGVDVFFVISGYLIAGLILKSMTEERFSFRDFYIRRMKRLLPAYLLMTLAVLLAGYLLLMPKEFEPVLRTALWGAVSASNFSLAMEGDYFAPAAELNPLLHTWSLAIEEQFYLVFPLVGWMLWRKSRRAFTIGLCGITALSLLHGIQLSMGGSNWAHFSPLARAWQLSAGCLLAIVHLQKKAPVGKSTSRQLLSAAAFAAIILTISLLPKGAHSIIPAVIVVGATLVLLDTGRGEQTLASRVLSHRLPVAIGVVSYSAYLWHQPIIAFSKLFPGSSGAGYVALVVVSALTLGFLSWKFVETPLRHWKGSPRRTLVICLLMIGYVAGLSAVGLRLNGFDSRFRAELIELESNSRDDKTGKRCSFWGNKAPERDKLCEFPATAPVGPQDADIGTVALWGDSHAGSLSAGMISAKRPFPFIHLAFSGCSVAPDVGRFDKPLACIEKGSVAEEVVMSRQDIKTIVIHGKWESNLEPGPTKSGVSRTESTRRFIGRLVDAGKRVILVRSVPMHDFNVPATAIRASRLGLDPLQEVSLDRYVEREASNNEALDAWAQEYGLTVLDTVDLLCSPETNACPSLSKDGKALYYDDDHLTAVGSRPLADRIVEIVISTGQ